MNGNLYTILMVVVLFGMLYFLMIRPQRRQQQQHQSMMSKIKKGDHVVMISRLHGVVDSIDEANKTVTIDADGIYLVFDLNAIASVTQQAPAATVEAPAEAAKPVEEAPKVEEPTTEAKPADDTTDETK